MHELLYNLPGVIYQYSIDENGTGKFVYVSPCRDILGIEDEDLMKDPALLHSIIEPEDLPSFLESQRTSHQTKTNWNWEGRIKLNDSIRWIETRSNAINPSEGNLRKGIIIDITERKLEEQKQEMRYRGLVEDLPLGIGICVKGEIVVANSYAHNLLHIKPGDLPGSMVIDFIHTDGRTRFLERMENALAGETISVAEEQFVTRTGELVEVEATMRPYTYKSQPAVQFILRDISDQKRTRMEIKKTESFFSKLFNNLPIAVVRLDETGKVVLVNPGFTKMFGYSSTELVGKNLNDFIVPEEFKNEGIDINNLVTSNKVLRIEAVRKNKSGMLLNVLLYGMPVWHDDEIIGIYGVYVDVTELKQVSEELKVRNAELDNFVYKVSHDLRAPLSSILGLINLSALPNNTDSPYEYLKLIGEKVNRLDHFITNVLSHSKNLKLKVIVERVDLKEMLVRTIEEMNYLNGAESVTFDLAVEPHPFFSDPWRISEIFRNLVSNAIKYRKLNHEKPLVNIAIEITDDYASIIFKDNGIGISTEGLQKIFDMFYRATEQSDGSGIGLYIVKNSVEKLNGSISVDSAVGKGTTFTIKLPNRMANEKVV